MCIALAREEEIGAGGEMRLQALDSWRGAAALLVVAFHAPVLHSVFYASWFRNMAPLLDLFFMLSGFVMALGFSDKLKSASDFWAYLIRRAGRAWPLHLAMLALLLPAPILSMFTSGGDPFWGWRSLDGLWRHVLLIQTWTPELALSWNFPAWTLCAELFAYLLMGLIALMSLGPRMKLALIGLAITISFCFFWNAMQNSPEYNVISISRGVFGFFMGMALYEFWRRWPLRGAIAASALELLATAGFVAVVIVHPSGAAYFSIYIAYALLIYVFAHDRGVVSRVIINKPLAWLGMVSFSMYVFHGVAVRWITITADFLQKRLDFQLLGAGRMIDLPEVWMNNLLALTYIAFVLLCTPVIYKFIEDPSRRYFVDLSRKFLNRTAQPTPARAQPSA